MMRHLAKPILVSLTLILLGSCATGGIFAAQGCDISAPRISADFPAARMNECYTSGPASYKIVIRPEDNPPINESPWYAFEVSPHAEAITIDVSFSHAKPRYWPKLRTADGAWARGTREQVSLRDEGATLRLSLAPSEEAVTIAGQEILNNEGHDTWLNTLSSHSHVSTRILGRSAEGRSIQAAESRKAATGERARPVLFLVGRQHPPELTGAFALQPFAETIFGAFPLAVRFRDVFDIVLTPNLNPDGVHHGHWRNNTRGVDLNRDWGPFKEPEIQLMKAELDVIAEDPARKLWLFLDFHSTQDNLLYTQTDEDEAFMPGFTRTWLERVRERAPTGYEFAREPRHNSDLPTSKNYVHTRFGVPAMTYEVGDETDRHVLARAARVFAEEAMSLLLEQHALGIEPRNPN